jgi:hypothetical protein
VASNKIKDLEEDFLGAKSASVFRQPKIRGQMQDLEKMATQLLETARKLPSGAEQHALLEQIGTFCTKLSAVAAKRKQLQSAK